MTTDLSSYSFFLFFSSYSFFQARAIYRLFRFLSKRDGTSTYFAWRQKKELEPAIKNIYANEVLQLAQGLKYVTSALWSVCSSIQNLRQRLSMKLLAKFKRQRIVLNMSCKDCYTCWNLQSAADCGCCCSVCCHCMSPHSLRQGPEMPQQPSEA